MTFIRGLFRWLLRLLLALMLVVAAYVAYAHWAYRDISSTSLELKYGGPAVRTAIVDGVPLRYQLEGSGPATVALIHSHYFDMGMWDGWVPLLAPHFRVLRYDLTGHGLTGPDPSGVYTVERDVTLLDGLLKQLQINQVALAGSSLGGNIAFTFAAQQPQRVSALVLINSGGLKRDKSRSGQGIPAWADQVLKLIPPSALLRFLHWMIADDDVITPALEQRFVEIMRREGNRSAEIARLRQFETGDADPLLAAIAAPTLVLWGESNPQLPVALATQFQKKLTAARSVQLKTYPGAGHVMPLERPQDSANDALIFLLAHTSSTPTEANAP